MKAELENIQQILCTIKEKNAVFSKSVGDLGIMLTFYKITPVLERHI